MPSAYDKSRLLPPRQARGFRSPCPFGLRDEVPARPGAATLRCREVATRKACGDFGAELREFNGEDDHVHLPTGYPPKAAVAELANSLKDVPARRLRPEFTGR